MLRLKRPADKSSESPAAILLITDTLQMLDPFFNRLDMTEHHRRARSQPELVRDLHHFQPLIAVNFQRRNLLAHAINQNFAAAARNGAQPRVFELGDHFTQRHPESFRKVLEFRRTESVDIDVGIFRPDMPQKIDIPPECQFWMMSTLHQNLNPARRRKFIELLIDLLERKYIMIFIFFGSIKRAEFAVNIANIRVINVSIDNVSDDLAAASAVASRLCQVPPRICQSAQFF